MSFCSLLPCRNQRDNPNPRLQYGTGMTIVAEIAALFVEHHPSALELIYYKQHDILFCRNIQIYEDDYMHYMQLKELGIIPDVCNSYEEATNWHIYFKTLHNKGEKHDIKTTRKQSTD
jgi:hypothetical protein